VGWPEHGLHSIEPDQVSEWAGTWFTAQNAVLWLSVPIPARLSLRELPQGDRFERIAPPPAIPPARSFVTADTRTVSLSVISNQLWGIVPAMTIARQRAFDKLRSQAAVSYSIEFSSTRITGGQTLAYLAADGSPNDCQQIFDGLVSVVQQLSESGPTTDELANLKYMRDQLVDHPFSTLDYLDSSAERRALGLPTPTPEEVLAKLDAQTPDNLRQDLESVLDTILAITPNELGEHVPGWSRYASWSAQRLSGKEFSPIGSREKGTMVVGAEGISWHLEEDRNRTIRWDEAVACLAWDNGLRKVIGPTGTTVIVAPWNWQGGVGLPSFVDDYAGASRIIHMGEGITQYQQDTDDAESTVDIRWIASIVGARYGSDRVDIVIDTDGIFLLDSRQTPSSLANRMKELCSANRAELLAGDSRNRWIPEPEIDYVKLRRSRWPTAGKAKGTLILGLHDGQRFTIHLVTEQQFATARNELPNVLGPRLRQS
jgi:hypothetical protein